ncbi:MAG: hypothetical protein AAF709_26245, partial [Pseudomonadota bacterium]
MTKPTEDLKALAEAQSKATPGQCLIDKNGYGLSVNTDDIIDENWPILTTRKGAGEPEERMADTAFVAAAFNADFH